MSIPLVHLELNTIDVAKAKSFYGGLFDWQLEDGLVQHHHPYSYVMEI